MRDLCLECLLLRIELGSLLLQAIVKQVCPVTVFSTHAGFIFITALRVPERERFWIPEYIIYSRLRHGQNGRARCGTGFIPPNFNGVPGRDPGPPSTRISLQTHEDRASGHIQPIHHRHA